MATLKYVSNGQTIFPELPIDREDLPIEDGRRGINGQLRTVHRATKKRLAYGRGNLSEAERATWITAHPLNTSFSHTDELGVTRTMKCLRRSDPFTRSKPAVNGGTNTTGPATYRVDVELEEV